MFVSKNDSERDTNSSGCRVVRLRLEVLSERANVECTGSTMEEDSIVTIRAESAFVSLRSILHAALQMGSRLTKHIRGGDIWHGQRASDRYSITWMGQRLSLDMNIGTLPLRSEDILSVVYCASSDDAAHGARGPRTGILRAEVKVEPGDTIQAGKTMRSAEAGKRGRDHEDIHDSIALKESYSTDTMRTMDQVGCALEEGGPLLKVNRSLSTSSCIIIPIQYGNSARWLEEAMEGERTHEWTTFVRCPWGGPIETVVTKVLFFLHPTFVDPERMVSSPPFEVSEVGWGQFLLGIHIYFLGCVEPHRVVHPLLLSPQSGPSPMPPHIPPHEKPLTTPRQKNDLRLVTYTRTPVLVSTTEEVLIENPTEELRRAVGEMHTNRFNGKRLSGNFTPSLPGERASIAYVNGLTDGLRKENRALLEEIRRKMIHMYELGMKEEPAYQ